MSELNTRTRSRRIKEERRRDKRKRVGGDDSDDSADFEPKSRKKHTNTPKRRRVRYGWACSMCKIKHRSCDGQRPCHRCRNEGFADTCNDGPAYQEDDVYKGKEPNRQFSCRSDPLCVTHHGNAVGHKLQLTKSEHVQAHHHTAPISACAYQTRNRQTEHHDILAKVSLASSLTSSPMSSPIMTAPGTPASPCMNGTEPFLFQFLEPPSWHQSPSTPNVPSFCTYLPPHFSFGPPFGSMHLDDDDDEEEEGDDDFFLFTPSCSSPTSDPIYTQTSDSEPAHDPLGRFLEGTLY